jgi:hypothetical protein
MKKILTEKNLAAVLFILVMFVFSLAHEDSKKRDIHYATSFAPAAKTSANIVATNEVKTQSVTAQP